MLYSENFSLEKASSATAPFKLSIGLQKIEAGSLVILKNIFFETGKFDLLPDSKSELQLLIDFLVTNPTLTIEIGGHTDDVGDLKANQLLSENRAKTVYSHLIANKISATRLSFKGFGKSKPVASKTSQDGRQQNRRTEFKVVKP